MLSGAFVVKKKIGTILDSEILIEAKKRAVLEKRALSDVFRDALTAYLRESGGASDSLRAWEGFCGRDRLLSRSEIDELLSEDML